MQNYRTTTHPDHSLEKEQLLRDQLKALEEATGLAYAIDHIWPISKGGIHHHDNLQVLPQRLNSIKSDNVTWSHPDYKNIYDLPEALFNEFMANYMETPITSDNSFTFDDAKSLHNQANKLYFIVKSLRDTLYNIVTSKALDNLPEVQNLKNIISNEHRSTNVIENYKKPLELIEENICIEASIAQSNSNDSVSKFITDMIEPTDKQSDNVDVLTVFNIYIKWCEDNDEDVSVCNLKQFTFKLESFGLKLRAGIGNKLVVSNIKLVYKELGEASSDTQVDLFISSCLLIDESFGKSMFSNIYEAYINWCKTNNITNVLGKIMFSKKLQLKKGIVYKRCKFGTCFKGVKLK